jgi:hypothetical protein
MPRWGRGGGAGRGRTRRPPACLAAGRAGRLAGPGASIDAGIGLGMVRRASVGCELRRVGGSRVCWVLICRRKRRGGS